MGTESPSPAVKPARARAVKRAIAAVDADATAAPVTKMTGAARDSDACVEERVAAASGLATSVASSRATDIQGVTHAPPFLDTPDKSNDVSRASIAPSVSTALKDPSDDPDRAPHPDDPQSDVEAFIESDPASLPRLPASFSSRHACSTQKR